MTPKKIVTNQNTKESNTTDELFNAMQKIGSVVEAHDQVLFQTIIGINILQKILIDKNIITIEELTKIAEEEAIKFRDKVEDIIK